MEKAAKAELDYTIAWMKLMNTLAKAKANEFEESKRESSIKGYLGKRV